MLVQSFEKQGISALHVSLAYLLIQIESPSSTMTELSRVLIILLTIFTVSASPTKRPEQKLAVKAKTNCRPNVKWGECNNCEQESQGKSEVRLTDDVLLFRDPNLKKQTSQGKSEETNQKRCF